jgi:hypothetical protein
MNGISLIDKALNSMILVLVIKCHGGPRVFQFDTPFLVSSFVLVSMGCVSALFALSLRRKLRAIERFPKNLSAEVFDKTFNVFDPYPDRRKTVSSHIGLLIFLAVYGPFIFFSFVVMQVIEAGLVLGGVILIVSLGLLMIDETLEIGKNADAFTAAVRKGVGFGKGDMTTLLVLKRTLPKLRNYHTALAALFFISSLGVPFIVDSLLQATAQLASTMFSLATTLRFLPIFGLIVALLLFAAVLVTIQFATGTVKNKILGFPSSEHIDETSLGRTRERMRIFAGTQHHNPKLRVPDPEDDKES